MRTHKDGDFPYQGERTNGRKWVFVFGSNTAGRHGAGAARVAKDFFGAEFGVGIGRTGDAYAIPTKDSRLNVLSAEQIKAHVEEFVAYANMHPELDFFITRVGCGLAGYKDEEIAPLFAGLTGDDNISVTPVWLRLIRNKQKENK